MGFDGHQPIYQMQQTNMRTSLEFINLYCPLEFVIDLAICKTLGEEKKKKPLGIMTCPVRVGSNLLLQQP